MVADGETVSRYILSARWLDKSDPKKPRLRPETFMAHPDVETSVFRVGGWDKNKLRATGVELANERECKHRVQELAKGRPYPDGKRSILLHGAALILTPDVRTAGLNVEPAEPPPRHAVIRGWPPLVGNRKRDEAAQLVYALKLVAKAEFRAFSL